MAEKQALIVQLEGTAGTRDTEIINLGQQITTRDNEIAVLIDDVALKDT